MKKHRLNYLEEMIDYRKIYNEQKTCEPWDTPYI